uniref:Protein FAR1-RELATED SEQUENCE n=1 Tax=Manihot esculenta TaxID=3983 RepID=A0A2C9V7G9_MANES
MRLVKMPLTAELSCRREELWSRNLPKKTKAFQANEKPQFQRRISLIQSSSDPYTPTAQNSAVIAVSDGFYSPEFRGDFGAGLLDLHAMDDTELLPETLDNSTENCASFDIHSLSSESEEDDALSSSSNEDEIQSLSTFNASKGTQEDNFQVPELGMVFSSDGEVYEFYKKYSKRIGFTVRKGKVHRSSNGDIRERFFFCSREGFRSKKQANKLTKFKRKETRTGCRARIRCTVENGKWVISQFCQEHNHQLDGFSKTFEPYLVLPTRNEAGATKYFEFGKMGCSTYVHEAKINSLQAEDAQSLINYFRHMQVEDSSFFYAVQVDANGCMTNFFWTDGRSKIDYEYFGDVLILDTAFKMDKFGMICAPFLGLNHHQQYVLFGCAFLLDKSNDSFCWLFETFMEAMRRRQPKTIFTDEGQPMVDAVKMVMPEANHQLGLWYVFRNVSKHLPTYYGQPDFASLFNKCISGCDTQEEFESRWSSLLEQFDLHKNACLNTLYMYRKRWAHVFNKRTFGAGIHCLENIKNIFQNFTSETMSLPKFVQQYFLAAEQQRREELYEDFHCNGSAPEMTLHYGLVEKQAASMYIHLHSVLCVPGGVEKTFISGVKGNF